jgi:serine/threonine protein kinase
VTYDPAVLSVGTILDGRYEILEPLAEGGMGAVYRARRRLLGDEVAIKIVRSEFGGDPSTRERFLREARGCAQLRHPNIVSILDYNVDTDGRPFLVMELLNGRSLRQEIAARGVLPIDEVQAIVGPLCGALQLAHDQGLLHRDLKPANIVAHDFGGGTRTHKIVDFGLVRVQSSDATKLTAADQFVGTFTYAAPEQMLTGDVGPRSDQYSLAVVVYELLAGRPPFQESDPAQLVTSLLTRSFPRPTELRDDLPKWVDVVVGRALAKSPDHRVLGHPVAIRLLRRGADRNWDAVRARFLREARTLQIAHPSIIQVRDYGEEGDLVYLVTDFIDGPSLRAVLETDGGMPWPRLRPLLAQLVEAAHVLHRKNGLLCGLSPDIMRVARDEGDERLMISTAGIWQAQDLLATMGDETVRGSALADVELHYVAPELLTGENADVRSDVFTMGVLAYEMATASLPYDGRSMPALLGAMLRGRPADPRERQPTLPESSAASILKALSPAPEQRYANAKEFAAALL